MWIIGHLLCGGHMAVFLNHTCSPVWECYDFIFVLSLWKVKWNTSVTCSRSHNGCNEVGISDWPRSAAVSQLCCNVCPDVRDPSGFPPLPFVGLRHPDFSGATGDGPVLALAMPGPVPRLLWLTQSFNSPWLQDMVSSITNKAGQVT